MTRAFCGLALVVLSLAAAARGAERPNVLFIAIDDLNDWVGCLQGHPQALTPNIDRLAERGVLFTNAHCAAPACNPSRAAVFSGRMPWTTGVWSNQSKRLSQQHPDMEVLPRTFANSGYLTLGTGKLMHSGAAANRRMFDQHFDVEQRWSPFTRDVVRYTKDELPSKGTTNPRHAVQVERLAPIILPLNRMPSDRNPDTREGESFDWGALDVSDSAMGDAQITNWAINRLKTPFAKPFFLGVGYYRPHIPLWAPAKYFERFSGRDILLPPHLESDLDDLGEAGRRWAVEPITAGRHSTVVKHRQWEQAVKAYLACTTFVDAQVGRLLKALDDSPYGDNTIVVLWSDHGWHLGEKQHWGKWTGWRQSTRVPLVIAPPRGDTAPRGKRCDQPVGLIDLYPTLIEMCRLPQREGLAGTSLAPLLSNPDATTQRAVLTAFDTGNAAISELDWRYLRYANGEEELYHLASDPHEWHNLAKSSEHAGLLKRMRRQFQEALPRETP